MENAIHIRLAKKSDAELIHNVLSDSFKAYQELFTEGAYAVMVVSPKGVEKRLNQGPIWIAEHEGEIAGTIGGMALMHTFQIRGMVVLPHLRGLKIGYQLLRYVENYARQNNYHSLSLLTTAHIDEGIRLYKKFGFKIINKPPYEIDGTHCIYMEKLIL
ncbi:MAG: GNAT family N-acetyltransferase [Bacteroidota bacterium]